MLVAHLLAFFWAQDVASAASYGRQASFRSQTTPTSVQGDIAVPQSHVGTGEELSAFLREPSLLWPNGFVFYWIETEEWNGKVEPLFDDEGVNNITQAINKIMEAVPCIKFK